jgi:hypothetical protein
MAVFSAAALAAVPVQTLSPAGQLAGSPQLDVDADGDAVVVWEARASWDATHSEVKVRGRSRGGVLSALQTMSAAGQPAGPWPQVAVDADGDAVVAWDLSISSDSPEISHVYARARSAGAGLSAVEAVSAAEQEAVRPSVDTDGSGRAVVVWAAWDATNWRVYARARSAGETWSAAEPVSEAAGVRGDPHVVMDGTGRAIVVWAGREGVLWRAYARVRSAAGTWSEIRALSPAGETVAAWPQVATSDDGATVVVWGLEVPCCLDLWRVQARALSPAGTWSSVGDVALANEDFTPPQVAVAGDGSAFVVWRARDVDGTMRIRGRPRSSTGFLGTVQNLSARGQDPLSRQFGAERVQVAMSPGGRAVVVWSRLQTWDTEERRIESRVRSPAGALFSVETLSPAGADGHDPQVAVDAGGRALAVWVRRLRIEAAVVPPDTRITSGPPGRTTRRKAAFRFRASESGSTFRCKLDNRAWRRCSSPKKYRHLAFGRHVFRVRAVSRSGQADPTPARRAFRVARG